MAHIVLVLFHLPQQVQALQVLQHLLPGGQTVQPPVGPGLFIHPALFIHNLDPRQVMAAADLKVVQVMGRGYFQRPGTKILIHVGIGDDRNRPTGQGQMDHLPGQPLITRILGMNGHRRIAQHGFRPGGGHDDPPFSLHQGITDMIEAALQALVFHFQIGKGRVTTGAPVDDVIPPVNKTLPVKADKDLPDRPGKALIHSEPLPAPVAGSPQAFELVDDQPAVFGPPLPDLFHELFPAQFLTPDALLGQPAFHHVLGGDTGMVRSRDPEDVSAFHLIVAPEDVLEGGVQGMAHMQRPGHVRRRNDHGKRWGGVVHLSFKQPFFDPFGVEFRLDLLGFVSLGNLKFFHYVLGLGAF